MRGVSLIEMMIALAIGSFLILGLVRVFSASRTAYQLSEGVSRVQENGRFAIEFIQRDLRMVGHMGCVNDQAHMQNVGALANHVPAGGSGVAFPTGIQAYEATKNSATTMNLANAPATWSPALPAAVTELNPLGGSDILQLRFLASEGVPVQEISIAGTNSTIRVTTGTPSRWSALTQGGVASPVMFGLADCSYVDLFTATATDAGAGTVTVGVPLDRYTPQPQGQTMLYRLESVVYFVGTGASGQRALMRARATTAGGYEVPEELVEGIESLQVEIGMDSNAADMPAKPPSGYIGQFVRPSTISNTTPEPTWRAVGAVRLGVLVASPDRSASEQPAGGRSLLGVSFTPADPADNRYRFGYESTVALRNRLYGN